MRYKDNGQLDDQPILDGDEVFKGFATKFEADQLEPGILSYAQNIRLDKGSIEPRKTAQGVNRVGDLTGSFGQSDILDMITYNDGQGDELLLSAGWRAWMHNGVDQQSVQDIAYPTAWDTINENGFLIQTNVSTMCFHNESVSLPFTADSSTSRLGQQVARLEQVPQYSQTSKGSFTTTNPEFILHKQVRLFRIDSASGDTRKFQTHETPTWDIGEVIEIWRNDANNLGTYRVTKIDGTNVECVPNDANTRPNWTPYYPLLSQAVAYSVEDQCPPGRFGAWAGNRLVVPTGRHDIAISSPLSTHDFPIYNQLTIGSQDGSIITALEPLVDDSLVVFKDSSVFIVSGVYSMLPADQGGNLAITRISDQMGCVNNRAKKIIGQEVIFVSKQGIYALSLNAKGEGAIGLPPQAVRITDMPMSNDIQDQLYGEDPPATDLDNSQLFFHRGRLYLFMDWYYSEFYGYFYSVAFIYNTILSRWESIDFYIQGFKKACSMLDANGRSKMFIFNEDEGIVELEKHEGTEDVYNSSNGNWGVTNWFRTRGYRFNTFANKLLRRLLVSGEKTLTTTNEFNGFYITSTNPETEKLVSDTIPEDDFNHRILCKSKGESFQVEGYFNGCRVKVKRLALEARDALRQTFKYN